MSSRKNIPSVLDGFLGTYTSRNSDYNGYWLFGVIIGDVSVRTIKLSTLELEERDSVPLRLACVLARIKFKDQMRKHDLKESQLDRAYFEMSRMPVKKVGSINGQPASGYDVRFRAYAISDLGRLYEREVSLFVSPHNAKREIRRRRKDRGPFV